MTITHKCPLYKAYFSGFPRYVGRGTSNYPLSINVLKGMDHLFRSCKVSANDTNEKKNSSGYCWGRYPFCSCSLNCCHRPLKDHPLCGFHLNRGILAKLDISMCFHSRTLFTTTFPTYLTHFCRSNMKGLGLDVGKICFYLKK